MKLNKKRIAIVLIFLVLFAIYQGINIRGDYLKTLEIGQDYLPVFRQNLKNKTTIIAINFVVLYITTYITTKLIHKGLKKFFNEEKKEFPKLPNKTICFILSTIISVVASMFLTEKAILAFNTSWFGISDPIFNIDIGFYMFQKPFIEAMIGYFIVLTIIYSIYIVAYYIICFNVYFDKGIDPEMLKKNTFIKHIITNIILVVIGVSVITLLNAQNIVFGKFLSLSNNVKLRGAGLTDATIKVWGYRLFAIIIPICVFMAIKNFKKESFKKVMLWLTSIPIYLVALFIIIIGFDLIYVKPNEFDREKKHIQENIAFTKKAYDIEIDEIEIQDSNTITSADIESNKKVINNVNLLSEEKVLEALKQYQSNTGYYGYNVASPELYKIDGQEELIYVSPREIVSNETRTNNNKTYEYTHGYGAVITSASTVDENGNISYIQSDFASDNSALKINEPRIYFGLETNSAIITNAKNKEEFDYPTSSTTMETNKYNGNAGLKLNFFDRLILGIKEKNMGIAFSGSITKDSKIITTRNIIKRAKTIMPYLQYDENPYMIVSDNGDLMWVLDAYTTSNNYPYSQESIIQHDGDKEKINYIRNSVKVLINPYSGEIKFYITDKSDPIAISYSKIYDGLFEDGENIPNEISKHFVYSEYLYNIQANILEQYHNIQPEILYRQDDAWDIAKENKARNTNITIASDIKPYYTEVKTVDSNKPELGLVVPYTILEKQNIISYLVGTCDENGNKKLTMYKFKTENAILGTTQFDALVEQDENISKELNTLNTTGTKLEKNVIVIPINNNLLYVEPIYQVMLNDEAQIPLLKKIIVASGNKVAIGNNLEEALKNLLSQQAIKIEIETENKDELLQQIITANENLKQSNQTGNWEMIGKDMAKLQELIGQLETIVNEETKQKEEQAKSDKNKTSENTVNTNTTNSVR